MDSVKIKGGEQRNYNKDTLYFVVFALMTVLPLSTIFNYARVVILGVLFLLKIKQSSDMDCEINELIKKIIISPILPVIFAFIIELGNVSFSLILHEIMRLIFACFAISVASKCRISYKSIYYIVAVVLIFNLIIQFAQYNGNTAVYDFIRKNYVSSEGWSHLDLSTSHDSSFRAGSIFVNPNVYMVIPLVSLAVFYQMKRIKDSILNKIFICCALVSCFFTGSRTSIIVSLAIILVYYVKFDAKKIPLLAVGGMILFVVLFKLGYLNSRAFELSGDQMGSLTVKFKGFYWYWKSSNPIYWLSGSLGSTSVPGIDCEWGHLYTWYGVYGLYWYINYYKTIVKRNLNLGVLSVVLLVSIALTAFTSGVLLVMQVFPFVCFICFSKKV